MSRPMKDLTQALRLLLSLLRGHARRRCYVACAEASCVTGQVTRGNGARTLH